MKFFVFHLQFINSLGGLGLFFSPAALICRLRRYAATGAKSGYINLMFEKRIFSSEVRMISDFTWQIGAL